MHTFETPLYWYAIVDVNRVLPLTSTLHETILFQVAQCTHVKHIVHLLVPDHFSTEYSKW